MEIGLVSTLVKKSDLLYMASAKKFCSLKAGGNFEYLVLPKTMDDFICYLRALEKHDIKFKVLGNMTNVLPQDQTNKGVYVCTKNITEPVKVFGNRVVAPCSCLLSKLCIVAKDNNLSGIEGLLSIPGTVGGAVVGNAGAFGCELCDTLESLLVYDCGKICSIDAKSLKFGYRTSPFKKNGQIILSATFMLHKKSKHDIMATMAGITQKRQTSQPQGPSLGSVFKKYQDKSAGYLIEQAGIKGTICGNMQISPKHANFIVNLGGGTCQEFKQLASLAQSKVYQKFGITLEREVEYIGENDESHSRLSHT